MDLAALPTQSLREDFYEEEKRGDNGKRTARGAENRVSLRCDVTLNRPRRQSSKKRKRV